MVSGDIVQYYIPPADPPSGHYIKMVWPPGRENAQTKRWRTTDETANPPRADLEDYTH